MANSNVVADQAWYIDSRATNHVTQNAGIFLSYSIYTKVEKLHIGNGLGLSIKHIGTAHTHTAKMALFSFSHKHLNYNIMHKRLGHPTIHALKQVLKSSDHSFDLNKAITPEFCSACQFGKSHMQHFPSIETSTIEPLELLHIDLWGPAPILSSQGYQYYISLLDDYTRFTWIFPLTAKSKAL